MANDQRGEVSLKLGGKEYILRPSFEALCELENRLNTTIPQLIVDLQTGIVSIKALATIIWAGIWGYDKDRAPTIIEVGEMVVSDGMINVISQGAVDDIETGPIVNFLVYGATGKSTAEAGKGEEKSPKGQVEPGKKS
jgi:hypothetical protein